MNIITMNALSSATCQYILSQLDTGHSAHQVSENLGVSVGTIAGLCKKHCSSLCKASGGHPCKLSPTNIQHAIHLITSKKAENAVQVRKALGPIIYSTISTQTVRRILKEAGIEAVVKKKKPLLTPHH